MSLRGPHDTKMKGRSLQIHFYVSVSFSSRASTLILFLNFTLLTPFPVLFLVYHKLWIDLKLACTDLVVLGALNLKHIISYKRDSTHDPQQQKNPTHYQKIVTWEGIPQYNSVSVAP